MIDRMNLGLPRNLRAILRETPELERAFLAGGCVRDALLGCAPKDFDVEVFGVTYEGVRPISSDALSAS
jgi:tRNA nucleotidyltransferase/poly(A) polymerase